MISEALRDRLDLGQVKESALSDVAQQADAYVIAVLLFRGPTQVQVAGTLVGAMVDDDSFELEVRVSLEDGFWLLSNGGSIELANLETPAKLYKVRGFQLHNGEKPLEFATHENGFAVRLHSIDFSRQVCSAIVNVRTHP